jgi:hypothetical protein
MLLPLHRRDSMKLIHNTGSDRVIDLIHLKLLNEYISALDVPETVFRNIQSQTNTFITAEESVHAALHA